MVCHSLLPAPPSLKNTSRVTGVASTVRRNWKFAAAVRLPRLAYTARGMKAQSSLPKFAPKAQVVEHVPVLASNDEQVGTGALNACNMPSLAPIYAVPRRVDAQVVNAS